MMSRWCDQSIPDERHSAFSSGPLEVAVLFGTLVAETILASVHVRAQPTGRTYGRKRSDQSTAKHLARRGPSTYGRKRSDQSTAKHLARRGPSTYGRKRSDQSTAKHLARRG